MLRTSPFDIEAIKTKMSVSDYSGALDLYLTAINDENANELPLILNEIRGLITRNVVFASEKLEIIKPLMTSIDEDVQELAIDIYTRVIKKTPALILKETAFCKEKISDFENIIRIKFIDFLIDLFPLQSDPAIKTTIIKILLGRLSDSLWKNRLRLMEFLNQQLKNELDLLRPFKVELLKILDEKDLDVANEGFDFLFHLIDATFTPDDLLRLIEIIRGMDWIAQEKTLSLIGQLGLVKSDLNKDALERLVLLLDAEEHLLQQKTFETIQEIMTVHPQFFNNALISTIRDEKIENIGAIERLLIISVEMGGYPRFLELFQKFDLNQKTLKHSFYNITKSLVNEKPALMEVLYRNLTNDIMKQPNPELFTKYIDCLNSTRNYDIYLICYNLLTEHGPFPDLINENLRSNCLQFMLNAVPELGFSNLSTWLKQQLKNGPITINELGQKFSMKRENVMKNLKKIIKLGLIDAIIIEDKIELPIEEAAESKEDLLLQKRLQVHQLPEEKTADITFFIKLTNTLKIPLSNFNIFLVYPHDTLVMTKKSKSTQYQKNLPPGESVILSWTFHRKGNEIHDARASFVKLMIIYIKNGKISSLSRKMDVLLL